jgi:poly(3-hydroxybutyrate) depolymerase
MSAPARAESRRTRRERAGRAIAWGALAGALACTAGAQPLAPGSAVSTFEVAGVEIEVHSYKPARYGGAGLLLVLHGLSRNAEDYRDYAIPLAERHGLLVLAPRFDRERFTSWRYQHGGIARARPGGEGATLAVEPEARWTARIVLDVIAQARAREGDPELPYYLIGHSAGGQALSRLAAFAPNSARRIVIANPSSYVWPGRELAFPDGFGGLPPSLSDDEAIRHYLAQPVTIFLGQSDVERDARLSTRPGAEQQGENRYQRGVNVFRAAEALARERGWRFEWRLVEVPGVGHSARRMFAHPLASAALLGAE